jgi:ketosteroid isomerase-like protein
MRRLIALALSLLGGPSILTAQAADPVEGLIRAERSAVEAVVRDGFPRGFYSVLGRNGVLLWPGAPALAGAAAAFQLLQAQPSLDSLRISWQGLGSEVAGDGTLGVTWGVAVAVLPSREARLGRYIAVWQREGDSWKLAAFVPIGLFPAAATRLSPAVAQVRFPPLAPQGGAAPFIAADLAFARLAGDSGAAVAFERFAAPDAVTFGGGGLNRGPAAIGRALRGDRSRWEWHPILAGAASSGELGWTVGESRIQPEGGAATHGKYLTIWRRLPDGSVRYVTDGGNARPATP